MLVVEEQLLASVTVKVYDPALTAKVPVPEYGEVPPVAVIWIDPLLPKQFTLFKSWLVAVRLQPVICPVTPAT